MHAEPLSKKQYLPRAGLLLQPLCTLLRLLSSMPALQLGQAQLLQRSTQDSYRASGLLNHRPVERLMTQYALVLNVRIDLWKERNYALGTIPVRWSLAGQPLV